MITPSQVESIFFVALGEEEAAKRAAFLDRACGEDSELRRRVERLLDAFPLAEGFLGRPAFESMLEEELADGLRRAGEADQGGDSPAAHRPLSRVGDYRILREIGRGGMGVVYEAEQISLGRRVALKVLPPLVSGDRKVQERFRREARAAARLHHTNIVPVFEVGQDGDVRFYAMQFIQGLGLDAVITELRRLRERSGSDSRLRTDPQGQSVRPRGVPSGHEIEEPTLGEGVGVGAVLRSILTGGYDPGGSCPESSRASPSMLVRSLATRNGTETERRATESDPTPTRTASEGTTEAQTS
jgi:hypothetical protein